MTTARCRPSPKYFTLALAVVVISSCGADSSSEPVSIRLVDRMADATVEGTPPLEPIEPVVWDFAAGISPGDSTAGTALGWRGIGTIGSLQARDGLLVGRITDDVGLLVVAIPDDVTLGDELHEIQVRMRVSAGTRAAASFSSDETLNEEQTLGAAASVASAQASTPVIPGDELQSFALSTRSSFNSTLRLEGIRHLVLRPTDVDGAEFAIESVRVVSRREHLRSIESGLGWQGQGNVFRETLVTRTPERVSFAVNLPSRPWLELHLGTIEPTPVTFRVNVTAGAQESALLVHTVTTADRWEPIAIDLSDLAGKSVTFALQASADDDRTIAYWGTPVIRQRDDITRTARASEARTELASDTRAPRGVLLIVADTLRRDHLPWHGGRRDNAPNLAALAEEGAVFTKDVSQATWTKVSVSSILTSLYPSSHGIVDTPDRLPSSVTTLAEVFQQAGYATFHTSSVPFTGRMTNLHQGVEVLHEAASIGDLDHSDSKTARTFVDRLLRWLETHRDTPFFAFLHVFDPHSPFEPYGPYDGAYMDDAEAEQHRENLAAAVEIMEPGLMKSQRLPSVETLAEAGIDADIFLDAEMDWYDASIKAMDVEVGRLLEKLDALGRRDDTLIVFMSDHGEEFLEHGHHWHGVTAYGEMLNVPLFFSWPGVIPTRRIDTVVQSIDVYPTLLDLARVPTPQQAQGQSLVPLMARPDAPTSLGWVPRPAFAERALIRSEQLFEDEAASYVIVADGWKLIRNTERPVDRPEYELFDYDDDPLDQNDVASDHPDVVELLAGELDMWLESALAARVEEGSTDSMSAEELEKLRALGYIQ